MTKINREEYRLLKDLDSRWKWIARDDEDNYGGHLFAYSEKTSKDYDEGYWDSSGGIRPIDNHLFQFIRWEDEEPYNIAELIEEYESEEAKVKKDIEWAIKEIEGLETETSQNYPHDEMIEREIVLVILNQLDELETLSPDWIGDNVEYAYYMTPRGTYSSAKAVIDPNKLKNLLLPEQGLPVIPQFVSGWIEETKKQSKSYIYAIAQIYDKYETHESLSEEENRIFEWMEAYDNDEVFARAWLDGYKIKKEPKYNVEFKVKSEFGTVGLFLYKKCDEIFVGDDFEAYNPKEDKYRLTEYEIKKYDERLWPFRKPVEEVEENEEN